MTCTRILPILLACLFLAGAGVEAQDNRFMPRDDYLEAVKEKFLQPQGITFDSLSNEEQARLLGYALSIELQAAGMDVDRLELLGRMRYMFQNRFGRRESEGYAQFFNAYLGMYDTSMQELTGVPPLASESILFADRESGK